MKLQTLLPAALLVACAGTETTPPKSVAVQFNCEIVDGGTVVSSPKVGTRTGHPITITHHTTGQPGVDFHAELVPLIEGDGLRIRGEVSLLPPATHAQSHAVDVTGATPKVEVVLTGADLTFTCQTSLPEAG